MAVVIVRDGEPPEKVIKRFKRLVDQEQILTEVKRREHYEKPSERKKKRERARRKRILKALRKQNQLM
ncbi:MAG TPA: 30S ribosomal protein S21 [Aquifex aeolicus]|nr:30S ribosomal protein S21 [Aquifex aeolicus]